nr:MAG TPA: hypothetical protein [Caudoviricetes sp.]
MIKSRNRLRLSGFCSASGELLITSVHQPWRWRDQYNWQASLLSGEFSLLPAVPDHR